MKRMMLVGPSRCGKTSLTQCMRGEALHYQKTQAIVWSSAAIDTPGEYLENRCLYSALLASACEADVIALVLSADAPWSPFSPGFTGPMNRPVIGLVTKADLANAQRISLVADWLTQAGAEKVFITSALTHAGLDEMFAFLNAEEPSCLTQ
ncbi:EutP/PduV family microcompartment system protein [[Enterobacter] lignolyticus]|uniref:Propanediol utilization protein n=1 Tax=[Enterobacter] lignolyticus TaxID=1334193 RepID=A0A806XBS9_9ENTR|nr:EutP/PduV family microcompartment system protein [[Enterobacter] lignolyticus]ALR77223.1 propanediol utilization protein [[Enterobacter] lignolyticus]